MPLFGLFGPPDIAKLEKETDIKGLTKAARYRKDWTLRRDAVQVLWTLALDQEATDLDSRQRDRLIETLTDALEDVHWNVRQTAVEALGEVGPPETLAPVIATTRDGYISVRWTAIHALIRLASRLPDSTDTLPIVRALVFRLDDAAWWVRQAAAQGLEKMAEWKSADALEPAIDPLQAAMQDELRIVRQAALDALIAIGAPPTIDSLIEALDDDAWSVRLSAAEALDTLGWEPEQEYLARYWIAQGDCHRCVSLGAPAVPRLVALLKDQYPTLRQSAIEALADLGDPAVEALIEALDMRDYWARAAAAETLGKIASQADGQTPQSTGRPPGILRQTVDPLLDILGDRSKTVREAAARALGHLGDRQAHPLLDDLARNDPDEIVRIAAQDALDEMEN